MNNTTLSKIPQLTDVQLAVDCDPSLLARSLLLATLSLLIAVVTWLSLSRASVVIDAAGVVRSGSASHMVYITASAHVDGRVRDVLFKMGDNVQQGDTLLVLDDRTIQQEISTAAAAVVAIQSDLAALDELERRIVDEADVRQRKAELQLAVAVETLEQNDKQRDVAVKLAQLELAAANESLSRTERLFEQRASSASDLSESRLQVALHRARLASAAVPPSGTHIAVLRENLELVRKENAVRIKETQVRRLNQASSLEQKTLRLQQLRVELDHTIVKAPTDGVITRGEIKPGDLLRPGSPVVEISPTEEWSFVALIANADIVDVVASMPARIRLDALEDDQHPALKSTITFVAPDATLQADTGNMMYEVRLSIDDLDKTPGQRPVIKLGMSGNAELIVERRSLLRSVMGKLRHRITID